MRIDDIRKSIFLKVYKTFKNYLLKKSILCLMQFIFQLKNNFQNVS